MGETIIYLIDDEPEMLEFLSDTVELAGFKAKTYTRAAHFFEQNSVFATASILVLDLNMPDMDGIEVMRKLSKTKDPPMLILISGHDSGVLHAAEKLGRAHDLEIIAAFNKPIPFDRLLQILEYHASSTIGKQRLNFSRLGRDLTSNELEQAIENNHLILHYQPQVDILTSSFSGVEALVRWQHPEKGLIFPDNFIFLAEESGLIGALTSWVINSAVEQQHHWQKTGLHTGVSVNISAENITGLTLPEQLAGLMIDRQLDPGMLTLEITESALMGELATSLDILTRLRLKGIRLSIDDFGTGYSSLSHLHRVPFTELKIDRSFVMNMVEDKQARSIVKTCIMLGHELNMQVVAEGVETMEHLELLGQLGCDIAQGYFISRPICAQAIGEMLQAGRFEPQGNRM